MTRPLLVVGDAILDRDILGEAERLCPEQPVPVLEQRSTRSAPGGAALAAALLARDGREVTLLTAIARDDAGCELSDLLADAGVTVVNVGLDGSTPEKVRLRAGQSLICRFDRGGGVPRGVSRPSVGRLAGEAAAVLVADYGGGLAADPRLRGALAGAPRLVWDPHPRGPAPVTGATLVTPNEREARLAVDAERELLAERLREHWGARAVCVTRGASGALLCERPGRTLTIPVQSVAGDPCGAGDRFASTATALVAEDVPLPETVHAACAEAASFVAGGGWHGGLSHADDADDPVALVERVHARGGTVVATGGCFDLLHAGHVSMLQSARDMGDCLVVLLNSDSSVRRLKGPDRPLVGEDDRASVLRSLECVDAVVLFDEDTPAEALRRLRPDVFVKGADYDVRELPESKVMRSHGGQVATVPYVLGHSTSGLIEKAIARDA